MPMVVSLVIGRQTQWSTVQTISQSVVWTKWQSIRFASLGIHSCGSVFELTAWRGQRRNLVQLLS
jgi:hypothetical protein